MQVSQFEQIYSVSRESIGEKIGGNVFHRCIFSADSKKKKKSAKVFVDPKPSLTSPWLVLEETFWNMGLLETKALQFSALRGLVSSYFHDIHDRTHFLP